MFEDLVGKTLNNYEVEHLIGTGGMAYVYRARDVDLDRYVAIKVMGITGKILTEFWDRFEREARTVAQLRHPNIVGIYHKGIYEGLPYLVMEYINGLTLSDLLKQVQEQHVSLDAGAILAISGSVTSALDYAHARGVIHRDVKPSNIMIDHQGMIYLADFGLALRMSEGTEGRAFGSPYYISPEQTRSSADVVPQSDLYSLGVILFHMLTGQRPFDHPNLIQVALLHTSQLPPIPSAINPALSPEVDRVIGRLLHKKPEARYQSGAEAHADLAHALGVSNMSRPTYQPYFLPSIWLSRKKTSRSTTAMIPTYLLNNAPLPEAEYMPDEDTEMTRPKWDLQGGTSATS